MKTVLITSTSRRHAYVGRMLGQAHDLTMVIRQPKGEVKSASGGEEQKIIKDHFGLLAAEEEKFFGDCSWDDFPHPVRNIPWGALNSDDTARLIEEEAPDAVVVFGCEIIRTPVLECLPEGRTFNLHQGLSPYYRGGGTNFWPFVEGRLEYIGVTLHLIDAGVDTGDIVAHDRPDIEVGDTQHSLGCKTIVKTAELLLKALELLESGGSLHHVKQWQRGKVYRGSDLTAEAILKAREREKTGYVSEFLRCRERGQILPLQLVRLER